MDSMGQLSLAVHGLPLRVARAMHIALTYQHCRIAPRSWENDLTVCPVVAAAKAEGIWENGGPTRNGPEWGTPDAPCLEVEEFAAWFDICCEDEGLDAALDRVRWELLLRLRVRAAA